MEKIDVKNYSGERKLFEYGKKKSPSLKCNVDRTRKKGEERGPRSGGCVGETWKCIDRSEERTERQQMRKTGRDLKARRGWCREVGRGG